MSQIYLFCKNQRGIVPLPLLIGLLILLSGGYYAYKHPQIFASFSPPTSDKISPSMSIQPEDMEVMKTYPLPPLATPESSVVPSASVRPYSAPKKVPTVTAIPLPSFTPYEQTQEYKDFMQKFNEMGKHNAEMQKQVEEDQKKFCEDHPSVCNH